MSSSLTFPSLKIPPSTLLQEIWYHEPETVTNTREINTFTCQPRSSVKCVTEERPVCKMASWQDCKEVPVPICQSKPVHVPSQEYLHRKKCLLPDDNMIETNTPTGQNPRGAGQIPGINTDIKAVLR